MKRVYLVGIAAAFLIALLSNPSVHEDFSGGRDTVDCRNSSSTCRTVDLNRTLSSCADSWRPWNPYSDLNCTYVSEGSDSVTLVSDAANYVDIPRTDADYTVEQMEDTGRYPWDMEFLPSGRYLITNKGGKVQLYDGDGKNTIADFDVVRKGENGLLGLAVDPDYSENNYVYLYYTYNISDRPTLLENETIYEQRVSRFKLVNGSLQDEKELVQVPGSRYHSGGRLEFGPDGKLYVTTGEAYMEYETVDPEFLGGKVLRMNTDGSVPEDNPFNDSLAYSMGHRNPQGIAWNPENGQLYQSEHGPWRYDELNKVEPGANYGWPYYRCDKRFKKSVSHWDNLPVPEAYNFSREPVQCWKNYTMAPSGMTFVNDTDSPWHGDLFVAGLRGNHLARFEFEGGEIQSQEVFYIPNDEAGVGLRLRDVEYWNGSLYVVADEGGMAKLTPE